eukprot:8247344-Pyramimonas_sp.AAC.1
MFRSSGVRCMVVHVTTFALLLGNALSNTLASDSVEADRRDGTSGDTQRVGLTAEEPSTTWCVQVTDLHISSNTPNNRRCAHTASVEDLLQLVRFVQNVTSPAPLCWIFTGDLTDGKRGVVLGGQSESEWKAYGQVVDAARSGGGLVLDLAGCAIRIVHKSPPRAIGSRRRNIPSPLARLALVRGISLTPSRDWLSSEESMLK